ncbi:MAG: hypothetical protein ACXWKP_21540 [Bradyrhizobium sp.]
MSLGGRVFGFVVLAALTAHIVTLLDFHSEQDQCVFGPVSNERYRELLWEAERYQWRNWPVFIWRDDTLQRLLDAQFQTMTSDTSTAYEKIAIMHAILRGIGADFLYIQPSNDPFAQVSERGGWVSFGYQINVNRLALFYPLGRTGWLIGSFAGPKRSSLTDFDRKHPQGNLSFVAHYPNPFDPIPDVLHRGPKSCPSVPNNEVEPSFHPTGK